MGTRIVVIFVWILILFRADSVCAEMRTWTNVSGDTLQAEYVREAAGVVILRLEDGTEIKKDYRDLSEADQQFVQLQNPPRLDIDVSVKDETRTVGTFGGWRNTYQLIYEILHPSVTIKKNALDDYVSQLTLELAIVGQVLETDRYILLDHMTQTFQFEQLDEFSVESVPIDLYRTRGSVKTGIEYYGYIAVVRDSVGETIAMKSNYSDLQRHADTILTAEPQDEFTRKFKRVKPRKPGGDVLPFIFQGM